jgi:DGQHR domain-containing protein
MLDLEMPADPDVITKTVPALRIRQPIGDIYLVVFNPDLLQKITFFDVRRVLRDERDVEAYLGIQRPLNEDKINDLKKYVNFTDATFPTAVTLAIDKSDYVSYDEDSQTITFSNCANGEETPSIAFSNLCRVIDGQHRIAGLEGFEGNQFDVMAAVFVGIDIADQAYVFATVNIEQTKVNRSLVYDLFDLAQTRSPFKTCHNIAVALDTIDESPFKERIKRLGTATPGREKETLTQSTFVNGLIRYISPDPKTDRDKLLRGEKLELANTDQLEKYCFRNMFIRQEDVAIGKVVQNYFTAIASKWENAWNDYSQGMMLNRTNGYRAFISILGKIYLEISSPGDVPSVAKFLNILEKVNLEDKDFNTENYKPGSGGESKLKNKILEDIFG